tara:strand:- start:1557 stop:1724 length:168 start_codon:yes stop_codon:yes gene_type:complete
MAVAPCPLFSFLGKSRFGPGNASGQRDISLLSGHLVLWTPEIFLASPDDQRTSRY